MNMSLQLLHDPLKLLHAVGEVPPEEVARISAYRFATIVDVYGWEPSHKIKEFLDKGAEILNETYLETPPEPLLTWVSANGVLDVSRDIYGYEFSIYSTDGAWMDSYAWIWDISKYNEILIVAKICVGSTGHCEIVYGIDQNNWYETLMCPGLSAKDIQLAKKVAGSDTILATYAIDISYGTPYPVAWYYKRDEGRHIVWFNKKKIFDVIDTELNPKYLGFRMATNSTSTVIHKALNPIVVVAV